MQQEKDLVPLEHFMTSTRPVTGAADFQVSSLILLGATLVVGYGAIGAR